MTRCACAKVSHCGSHMRLSQMPACTSTTGRPSPTTSRWSSVCCVAVTPPPARYGAEAASPPEFGRPQRQSRHGLQVGIASDASCRRELAALRADAVEQLGERVGELLHALLLEDPHDVVVVDTRLGELVEEPTRLVDTLLERQRDFAVILAGPDRFLGHRVTGVGGGDD